jgi:hypothetical protein
MQHASGKQPPQDTPRGMEIAKKFGPEFLPPPGAQPNIIVRLPQIFLPSQSLHVPIYTKSLCHSANRLFLLVVQSVAHRR